MDFWHQHGWLFLLGCAFFPRITTLFFSSVSFGLWHILGWIFTPHLLVAILATIEYGDTNPGLVLISWLFALGGTGGEATVAKRGARRNS